MTAQQIAQRLTRGTVQVIPMQDLVTKLEKNVPLRIKLGMDPTSPDLHLGHAVVLSKLRQFQELGHEVIFLIGDFTARIGDPTGKTKTRPALTEQEIMHNMKTYFEQVGRILDPAKLKVRYNSEWLDAISSKEMVQLCAKVTLARIIEREDFAQRMEGNKSIGFHELLYPLMQGYDSVALRADVELGGSDQTFNLLMGRTLQEHYGQEAQVIITTPLLEGLDGNVKMSKSLGNAIGLTEPAHQAYGKLMSMSDTLMWRYMNVLLDYEVGVIAQLQQEIAQEKAHPMDIKKKMAHDIVARFWSSQQAAQAQEQFEALFQKKDYSHVQEIAILQDLETSVWIVDVLKKLNAVTSSSQARRLIQEGAVTVDEQVITDFKATLNVYPGMLIKVGKHRLYRLA
jgi:tyrosyl-tRNA synthetase